MPDWFEPREKLMAGKLNRVLTEILNLVTPGGVPNVTPTGRFYSDVGAKIARFADRLFVGAAADNAGQADRDAAPRDWLSDVMGQAPNGAWMTWGATFASLSRFGGIGGLFASRTSDARAAEQMLGYVPASIGSAHIVINDDTAQPTTTTGWASYGEAWRMPGVNYQPTFCYEMQAINFGGANTGASTPYHVNVGGGVYCVQYGSGGGQATYTDAQGVVHQLADAEAPWTVTSNHARFRTGPVFGADAIAGTDGLDDGYAAVFLFGRNQALEWRTPQDGGTRYGAFIRSTVRDNLNATRQVFTDYGFELQNTDGRPLILVRNISNPDNILRYEPGAGQQAAGFYAMAGPDGNPNIALYPGPGGEFQIGSPTDEPAVRVGTAPSAWWHININGTDYRVPALTPDQTGADLRFATPVPGKAPPRVQYGTADRPTASDLDNLVVFTQGCTVTADDLGGYGSYSLLQAGGSAVSVVAGDEVTLVSDKATPSFSTARRGAVLTVLCAGDGTVFVMGNTA